MGIRTFDLKRVQKRAQAIYRSCGKSWTKAAHQMGVSRGTLIRVAAGYEPKQPDIRRALGLPIYISIVTCAKCGKRHDEIKTCPDKRRRIRHSDKPIASMPIAVLHWKLINREVME